MLFKLYWIFDALLRKQKSLERLKFSVTPLCGAAVGFFTCWTYKPEVEDGNYKLWRALAVTQEFRGGQKQALHMLQRKLKGLRQNNF